MLAHDLRRGDLDVTCLMVDLAPIAQQLVLQDHAVRQEEREARGLVAHHEEIHLAADLAVVALLGLFKHVQMLIELRLGGKRRAVYSREHLVRLIGLPIGTRDARELECFERLGVGDMRTHAHIDVLALLEEGDASVIGQVADVLDLVLLAALLHERDGLLARQLEDGELEVLLHDLLHLVFDRGQIVFGERLIAQIDIVVEAVIRSGAIGEVGLRVEALDSLRHDVRGGMPHDMRDLLCGKICHMPIVIQCFHSVPRFMFSQRDAHIKRPHATCGDGERDAAPA